MELTDRQIQAKLNQLVKIANELQSAAKQRYGEEAFLFYESEGGFHIMAGDSDSDNVIRQNFIRASSHGWCRMGCGAW